MADIIDDANAHMMNLNADSLKAIRSQALQERHDLSEDEEYFCESCDSPIPFARARLGATLCVPCKEFEEKRSKQYGRKSSRYDYDD